MGQADSTLFQSCFRRVEMDDKLKKQLHSRNSQLARNIRRHVSEKQQTNPTHRVVTLLGKVDWDAINWQDDCELLQQCYADPELRKIVNAYIQDKSREHLDQRSEVDTVSVASTLTDTSWQPDDAATPMEEHLMAKVNRLQKELDDLKQREQAALTTASAALVGGSPMIGFNGSELDSEKSDDVDQSNSGDRPVCRGQSYSFTSKYHREVALDSHLMTGSIGVDDYVLTLTKLESLQQEFTPVKDKLDLDTHAQKGEPKLDSVTTVEQTSSDVPTGDAIAPESGRSPSTLNDDTVLSHEQATGHREETNTCTELPIDKPNKGLAGLEHFPDSPRGEPTLYLL